MTSGASERERVARELFEQWEAGYAECVGAEPARWDDHPDDRESWLAHPAVDRILSALSLPTPEAAGPGGLAVEGALGWVLVGRGKGRKTWVATEIFPTEAEAQATKQRDGWSERYTVEPVGAAARRGEGERA